MFLWEDCSQFRMIWLGKHLQLAQETYKISLLSIIDKLLFQLESKTVTHESNLIYNK